MDTRSTGSAHGSVPMAVQSVCMCLGWGVQLVEGGKKLYVISIRIVIHVVEFYVRWRSRIECDGGVGVRPAGARESSPRCTTATTSPSSGWDRRWGWGTELGNYGMDFFLRRMAKNSGPNPRSSPKIINNTPPRGENFGPKWCLHTPISSSHRCSASPLAMLRLKSAMLRSTGSVTLERRVFVGHTVLLNL